MDKKNDDYAFGMDWGQDKVSIGELTNYRQYQYDLIKDFIGTQVFEVGSGASRSFTKLLVKNNNNINRLLSTEPSDILFDDYKNKNNKQFHFPDYVEFANKDIFDMTPDETGQFDTVIYIHVLEHIKEDKKALNHTHQFLKEGGHVLIEVPALPFLFSVHDEMLGHYRRYTKKMMKSIVDENKYTIKKLWYNDPVGVIGSFLFFKLGKVKLKSEKGVDIVSKQGQFYDKYLIPAQSKLEQLITFPFGLSLTAVLQKK